MTTQIANDELWSVFNARRVKMPELKGLDAFVNKGVGWAKNRRPLLSGLKAQAKRVEVLEKEIHELGAERFREEVAKLRDEARLGRLEGPLMDRALGIAREAAVRATGLRPYPGQIMGGSAMCHDLIAEMATGVGKALTASLAASLLAWES